MNKPQNVTFDYYTVQGAAKIMEKIASLTFQKIAHLITAIDCQPSFDGGIVINVLGQLKVRRNSCIVGVGNVVTVGNLR